MTAFRAGRLRVEHFREHGLGSGYSRDERRRAEGSARRADAAVREADRPQGAFHLHRDQRDPAEARGRREARHGADAGAGDRGAGEGRRSCATRRGPVSASCASAWWCARARAKPDISTLDEFQAGHARREVGGARQSGGDAERRASCEGVGAARHRGRDEGEGDPSATRSTAASRRSPRAKPSSGSIR